jgi:hypothetical protein
LAGGQRDSRDRAQKRIGKVNSLWTYFYLSSPPSHRSFLHGLHVPSSLSSLPVRFVVPSIFPAVKVPADVYRRDFIPPQMAQKHARSPLLTSRNSEVASRPAIKVADQFLLQPKVRRTLFGCATHAISFCCPLALILWILVSPARWHIRVSWRDLLRQLAFLLLSYHFGLNTMAYTILASSSFSSFCICSRWNHRRLARCMDKNL